MDLKQGFEIKPTQIVIYLMPLNMLLSSDQNESIDEIHISKKYVCF